MENPSAGTTITTTITTTTGTATTTIITTETAITIATIIECQRTGRLTITLLISLLK
jgi:hypothetical protein